MLKKIQRAFALSEQGAKDLIKGSVACVFRDLALMFPVGLLYYLVRDLLTGTAPNGNLQ